jgi:hypothetical protein
MGLLRTKFWQWMIAGALLGLALAYFAGRQNFAPSDKNARVNEQFFFQQIRGKPLPDGTPRASHIVLYPINSGIQLVKFDSAIPDAHGQTLQNRLFLYTRDTQIAQHIQESGQTSTFAWWAIPQWAELAWGGGAFFVLGILWPSLLFCLRPPTQHASLPRAPEPPKPASTFSAKLNELDSALEAALTSAPANQSAAPPPPKRLESTPLQPIPDQSSKEQKQYEGVFYPVEHPHKKSGDL